MKKNLTSILFLTFGWLAACVAGSASAFGVAVFVRCLIRAWRAGWTLFALALLLATGSLPALATDVLFPVKSMYLDKAWSLPFTITARTNLLTDGTNFIAALTRTVTPTGTNPIIKLRPNKYDVFFPDLRRTIGINVYETNGVVSALALIEAPLPSFTYIPPFSGAAYTFRNTNLLAGVVVTNGSTIWIGTNPPAGSAYSFTATNLPVGSQWVTNGNVVSYGTNTSSLLATNGDGRDLTFSEIPQDIQDFVAEQMADVVTNGQAHVEFTSVTNTDYALTLTGYEYFNNQGRTLRANYRSVRIEGTNGASVIMDVDSGNYGHITIAGDGGTIMLGNSAGEVSFPSIMTVPTNSATIYTAPDGNTLNMVAPINQQIHLQAYDESENTSELWLYANGSGYMRFNNAYLDMGYSGNYAYIGDDNGGFWVGVNGQNSYFNTTGGNFGIGTTSPQFPLDVQSGGQNSGYGLVQQRIYGNNGATESGVLIDGTANGGRKFSIIAAQAGSGLPAGAFAIGNATDGQPIIVWTDNNETTFYSSVQTPYFDLSGHGYNSDKVFSLDAIDDWDGSTQMGYQADGHNSGAAYAMYAKGYDYGAGYGRGADGHGAGNFAAGYNAVIPDGYTDTVELGTGTATVNGSLNFRGRQIADGNGSLYTTEGHDWRIGGGDGGGVAFTRMDGYNGSGFNLYNLAGDRLFAFAADGNSQQVIAYSMNEFRVYNANSNVSQVWFYDTHADFSGTVNATDFSGNGDNITFTDNSGGANWLTTTPATLTEAINRIAAVVSAGGTTPIP